jgi:transcriptional regulator with XRE-family HTH domain
MSPVLELSSLGRLIAEQRCARGLTLAALAANARVGRSTLAALETGRMPELGFTKVARICAAVGISLETRPPLFEMPRMPRRDLTRAAIEEVILHGDLRAWRRLVRALRSDKRGRLAARVRQVVGALGRDDSKVAAFVALLPGISRMAISRDAVRSGR